MAYFDNAKIGDRVWDFKLGFGQIKSITNTKLFEVVFTDYEDYVYNYYDRNGRVNGDNKYNQVLFWDEIKFTIPEPPKREYEFKSFKNKYVLDSLHNNYFIASTGKASNNINLGLYRHTKEQAKVSLERIKKANRLEMLVYDIQEEVGGTCFVYKQFDGWNYDSTINHNPGMVKMYKETAIKVCEILNNGEYEL